MGQTRSQFANYLRNKLPDNILRLISPEHVRQALQQLFSNAFNPEEDTLQPASVEGLEDALELALRVGNNAQFPYKVCTFVTLEQYANDPNGQARDSISGEFLCIGAICDAEFSPTAEEKRTVLVYDEDPDLNDPNRLLVYRDASFSGARVFPAKWLPISSPKVAEAGVIEFDPFRAEGYKGPDENQRNATLIRQSQGGVYHFYTPTEDLVLADYLPDGFPDPSQDPTQATWKEASPPAAAYQPFATMSWQALENARADDQVPFAKLIEVHSRPGNKPNIFVTFDSNTSNVCEFARIAGTAGLYRYSISNDTHTAQASGSGGPGLTPEAFASLQHSESKVVFQAIPDAQANDETRLIASFAAESVGIDNLRPDLKAELALPELLLITTDYTTDVFRKPDELLGALNAISGVAMVDLRGSLLNTNTLVLKPSVTYRIANTCRFPKVFSDGGQPINTDLDFSAAYSGERRIALANVLSKIRISGTIEGTEFAAITANAKEVTHNGTSYSRLAEISGNTQFIKSGRHLCGGSVGIVASGNSVTTLTDEISAGFNVAVQAQGNSRVHLRGGSQQTFPDWALAYCVTIAGTAQVHLYAGRHSCAARPYAAFIDSTAELHIHAGAELPTPSEGKTVEGGGIVHIHYPCTIDESTIDADATIIRHGTAGGGGGGEDTRKQVSTINAERSHEFWREGLTEFSNIILAENAASVKFQLWQNGATAGPERTTAADINADIAGLADTALYMVNFITVPTVAANRSTVILTVKNI